MSKTGYREPGDYNLQSLSIKSSDGKITDIKSLVSTFSMYESIYNHNLSADMMVTDGLNLISTLNLKGGESVSIKVSTPGASTGRSGSNASLNVDMVIYKISKRVHDRNNSVTTYIMHLTHPHNLIGIQKYYNYRKNGVISDIVSGIMSDIPASCNAIPTNGNYNLIIPNLNTWETIVFLSNYAVADKYKSSSYLFWQDHNGYNYKPLEYMVKQEVADNFTYYRENNSNFVGVGSSSRKNFIIMALEVIKDFDVLFGTNFGQFGAESIYFDAITHKIETKSYRFETDFSGGINSTLLSKSTEPTVTNLLPSSIPHTYAGKNSMMLSADYLKLKVEVPGDLRIVPGIMINIVVPDDVEKGTKDKRLSGKFLVTSCRHMFESTTFKTVMEVMRDSYAD